MSATVADVAIFLYVTISVIFDDGSPPVQVARVLLILGAATDLTTKRFTRNRIQLWQCSFVAFAALSTIWAWNTENAWAITTTLCVNGICVVVIAYLIRGDPRRVKILLLGLVIAPPLLMLRVAASYGILAFFGTRATDTTSANIVGMTAAFGFCLAYLGFSERVFAARWVCGLFIALNLAVTVLSASRKALLIVGVAILAYAILNRRSRAGARFFKILLVCAVILIAYWLIMSVGILYELVGNRIQTMFDGFFGSGVVDASTSTRIDLVDSGMEWFREKPWAGHGGDNFRYLMEIYNPRDNAYYAHNNFVELLVDFGVIGLALFYWMYAYIIAAGVKRRRSLQPLEAMILSLMIALVINEYGFVSYYDRVFMLFVTVAWAVLCTGTFRSPGIVDPGSAQRSNKSVGLSERALRWNSVQIPQALPPKIR